MIQEGPAAPRTGELFLFLMPEKAVIILDGGFVKKKLQRQNRRFPLVQDIRDLCADIMSRDRLKDCRLLRVYYYDAPPLDGKSKRNPIDGSRVDFGATRVATENRALIDSLELEPDFAVRRGELHSYGWKLGDAALKRLKRTGGGQIGAADLVPEIGQKGVDMRIGLDISSTALKRTAEVLVLVTGDSDFVPPMKFARKEGMRIYLECMGHAVKRELKAHADFVF